MDDNLRKALYKLNNAVAKDIISSNRSNF